jgi:hypothetical protein
MNNVAHLRHDKKPPRQPKEPREHGLMTQVRVIMKESNRLALFFGILFGGLIPTAVYVLIHQELTSRWYYDPKALLVLGGLVYSAKTVVEWARHVFKDTTKALGFAVLLEGVMSLSSTQWLAFAALATLALINTVAASYSLSSK